MPTDGVKIDSLRTQLAQARFDLATADLQNPNIELSSKDMYTDPFRIATGQNGIVEEHEVANLPRKVARDFYETTRYAEGVTVPVPGAIPGSKNIVPAPNLNYGEIGRFKNHVESILSRLDGDHDGIIREADLARLPGVIDAFYTELYRGSINASAKLSPIFHKRVEDLIRQMFALERAK